MKNAVILGASGYTGAESVRLISAHPHIKITGLTAHSNAGMAYGSLYPQFSNLGLPDLVTTEEIDWNGVDVVFACLPHGASQETIAAIYDRVETVIDLSADFRLRDPALYESTYGRSHDFPHLLKEAVYGLSEYARAEISGAKLIACPGCYPTCSLLALLPGIDGELFSTEDIIIDAKSGVTGAGRKSSTSLIFPEISDGAHAYGVSSHRHAPEIDQMLEFVSGEETCVSFTPHLLPMNRGMISTIYVRLSDGVSIDDLRAAYEARYAEEPFIDLLPKGQVPQTRHIRGSNLCKIGIFPDRRPDRAILVSVIDNLTKGSAGQALQNYNISRGWPETTGLDSIPVYP